MASLRKLVVPLRSALSISEALAATTSTNDQIASIPNPSWLHCPFRERHSVASTAASLPFKPPSQLTNLRYLQPNPSWAAAEFHTSIHSYKTPSFQSENSTRNISSSTGGGVPKNGGWTFNEVVNLPNSISFLRLLSGPLIASWIIEGRWEVAVPALVVSGASDWLDGYFARNRDTVSVLGSYLDPLADKVLIVSVVGALGYTGALPGPLVGVIVGRDVFLIVGAFAARAHALQWKWPGVTEFFRVTPAPLPTDSVENKKQQSTDNTIADNKNNISSEAANEDKPFSSNGSGISTSSNNDDDSTQQQAGVAIAPAAPVVQPFYISKVNTALQLVLVGGCMTDAWLGFLGSEIVWGIGGVTAGTTLWSCVAYIDAYRKGEIKLS